jgi:hypothetical protein
VVISLGIINQHISVILTRFSRVTFNAAHRYLGLTSELLRAEKSINELAKHPLPSRFYESGGLERLRARFPRSGLDGMDESARAGVDQSEGEGHDTDQEKSRDYFSLRRRDVDGSGSRLGRAKGSTTSLSSNATATAASAAMVGGMPDVDVLEGSSGKNRKELSSSSSVSSSQKTPILSNRNLAESPSSIYSKAHPAFPTSTSASTSTSSILNSSSSSSSKSINKASTRVYGHMQSATSSSSSFPRLYSPRDQVDAGDLHTSAANPGLGLDVNMTGLGNVMGMHMGMKTPRPSKMARRPSRWGPPAAVTPGHSGSVGRGDRKDGARGRRRTIMLHLEDVVEKAGGLDGEDGEYEDDYSEDVDGEGEGTDFNLRDEVMACIAKSIGLLQAERTSTPSSRQTPGSNLQPPDSFSAISTPTRPSLSPRSSISARGGGAFKPSFGSLSMLDKEFDLDADATSITTSVTSASELDTTGQRGGKYGYMSGLENEVEILFFPAGSVLVKAGERNAGKFYFMILPMWRITQC